MSKPQSAAALLSIAHERARLKRNVLGAYAAGDLAGGTWMTQVRDELARQGMRLEGVRS